MSKIQFVRADERSLTPSLESVTPERRASMTPAELAEADHIATFTHHPGDESSPNLFEVRFEPNTVARPHAHAIDEVIVVVEGSLSFGNRVLVPGSSVLIPSETLYSFTAGPDGVRFLNFRATRDNTVLNREQLLARRAARG